MAQEMLITVPKCMEFDDELIFPWKHKRLMSRGVVINNSIFIVRTVSM